MKIILLIIRAHSVERYEIGQIFVIFILIDNHLLKSGEKFFKKIVFELNYFSINETVTTSEIKLKYSKTSAIISEQQKWAV